MGSHVRRVMQALLGLNVVYTEYPLIGAGVAAGVLLVNAGGANTFGADTEIVPNTIATEFWFCSVTPTAISISENFVADIRTAAAVHIYAFRLGGTAITPNLGPFAPPYPVRIPPLTQVVGRCASVSGADTVSVSVCIATGL